MRYKIQALVFGIFMFIAPAAFAAVDTYSLNDAHTSFTFAVQHMMINNVPGEFDKFSGTIMYSPTDLDNSKANITIDTASIDTHVDKRDTHLKSSDFFDAAKYPTITFVSTKFIKSAIAGDLTMKGVTKHITIPVVISGPVKNMMGGQSIGITGTTIINRQDWGISWNKNLDSGGVVVADEVTINISIEADRK
jgi:polyisoprenoid-binding protein YceI